MNQFLHIQSGVDRAISMASELVRLTKGQSGGTQQSAINSAARSCHVTPAQLRRLVQPSRRPKHVGFDLFERLRAGYLAHLRRQLNHLKSEVARVEALGPSADGARADLVREAKALVDRLERNL